MQMLHSSGMVNTVADVLDGALQAFHGVAEVSQSDVVALADDAAEAARAAALRWVPMAHRTLVAVVDRVVGAECFATNGAATSLGR